MWSYSPAGPLPLIFVVRVGVECFVQGTGQVFKGKILTSLRASIEEVG
jgi:hypothetical protein